MQRNQTNSFFLSVNIIFSFCLTDILSLFLFPSSRHSFFLFSFFTLIFFFFICFTHVLSVLFFTSFLASLISFFLSLSPHGIMGKVLDCSPGISEFKFQSSCYIHFQTNTLGKGKMLLISQAMKIISLLFFYMDAFSIE